MGQTPIYGIMGQSGLGRLVHQSMFGVRSLYRTSIGNIAAIADDYVLGNASGLNNAGQNPNYPLIDTSVCFNVDTFNSFPYNTTSVIPNQSVTKPIFVSIGDRVQEVDGSAGKQYELDTISAGECTFNILDLDEDLNPTNPNSPFFPNVKVYRQLFDGAMWPPVPLGGATNLLNTGAYYPVDSTMESYVIGTTPTPFIQIYSTTAPIIDTTHAHSGTQSLKAPMLFDAISGSSYVGWMVPCIPGQKYTSSVYAFTDQAFPTYLRLFDGDASGFSMNVANTWTRLSITFTATKPIHIVEALMSGPIGSPNMWLDDFQHEPGGVATDHATTGPLLAGLFGGMVERWPASWNYHGIYGMANITATDAFGQLSNALLNTELQQAILDANPSVYWPLNDGDGANMFAEQSGNNGPPLIIKDSKFGDGGFSVSTGSQTNIVGDPSGVGVQLDQTGVGNTGFTLANRYLAPIAFGGTGGGSAFTIIGFMSTTLASVGNFIEVWGSHFNTATGRGYVPFFSMFGAGDNTAAGAAVTLKAGVTGGTLSTAATAYKNNDGNPHMFAAIVANQSLLSTTSVNFFIDGVLVGGATTPWSTFGSSSAPDLSISNVSLFGELDSYFNVTQQGGTAAHIAIFNRPLGVTEISNIWNVANKGYSGDTTGERITRYIQHNQFSFLNIDAGMTTLGPSSVTSATAKLDAIQAVGVSENGNFFIDGFGLATFQDRAYRYLATEPVAVFGEDAAAGEIPYADDISFDFDPQIVYNDIEIDQTNGVTAKADDADSQSSYGVLSLQLDTTTISANEAFDYANWILITHSQPSQRVSGITITPSANPNIWYYALWLKMGDRVTVKRRTTPGYVMSADYFIERIERSRDTQNNFTVSYQLSPVPMQPWILGDPVYGILDSTTILGF